jgi:glycosyltransferase involved in cell wall biosynthesis
MVAELACLQFNRLICVNDEIAVTLRDLGVASNRIDVIPAFLPFTARPVKMPPELDTWMEERSPILSTAMFFRPEYGFELLVSGLKKLVRHRPRLGCLVMGSGEQHLAAEMLTNQLGLRESVRFLGDVDHEMCLALIARSNVFVRPTYQDGDSLCVREAVSLGVPVVASQVGTRPAEVLLFEPGNVDQLVSQLNCAIDTKTAPLSQGHINSIDRLLNLYSFLIR